MKHTHFVLDTVNLLAGSMARRIPFNVQLSTAQVWSHLDTNFGRYKMKVSFDETRDLIVVFQADLTAARMQLIKAGAAQSEEMRQLMDFAEKADIPETS